MFVVRVDICSTTKFCYGVAGGRLGSIFAWQGQTTYVRRVSQRGHAADRRQTAGPSKRPNTDGRLNGIGMCRVCHRVRSELAGVFALLSVERERMGGTTSYGPVGRRYARIQSIVKTAGKWVESSGRPTQCPPIGRPAKIYIGLCISAGVGARATSKPAKYHLISSFCQSTAYK